MPHITRPQRHKPHGSPLDSNTRPGRFLGIGERQGRYRQTMLFEDIKSMARIDVASTLAENVLHTPDDGVAIERVEFEYPGPTACLFCGDDRGARSGKGIEDDLATP